MNPRVGREAQWPETPRAQSPKRLLIVGGGPAGLEAARIAALAGHTVTLWERSQTLGGRLNKAGLGHGRQELHAMRDWLIAQARSAGAQLLTGLEADVERAAREGAELVILACGADYSPRPSLEPAIDVESALSLPRPQWAGQKVAIIDEAGSWATLSAAETLAAAGASVDLIAPSAAALWSVTLYSRMTALERLSRAGVRLRQATSLIEVQDGLRLLCQQLGTGERITLGPFDRLIHSAQGVAATEMQHQFEQTGLPVRVIGDALAPRRLFDAMHDAQSLIRSLEPAA